jgi:CheY-like chemotaxis protein
MSGSAARQRVLIVDDSVDSAESLAMWLRLMEHDVRTVHHGAAALEAAIRFRPDVVLLDIGLPGMSGYEVARQLRARPETKHALLVALTGFGAPEDRRRSEAAGFDHHLVKPIDPDALAELIAGPPPPRAVK